MTGDELLGLQCALVHHLADPRLFAVEGPEGAALPEALAGLPSDRLELLALLALGKRVSKVATVMPRTAAHLPQALRDLAREFARGHPPLRADNYATALQFYRFLRRSWRCAIPQPPFLPDLAYAELGMVAAAMADAPGVSGFDVGTWDQGRAFLVRRRAGTHLRRCAYDIRPLLAPDAPRLQSVPCDPVCLVFSRPAGSGVGRAFEVNEALFATLSGLAQWRLVRKSDDWPLVVDGAALLRNLEDLGILELRPLA